MVFECVQFADTRVLRRHSHLVKDCGDHSLCITSSESPLQLLLESSLSNHFIINNISLLFTYANTSHLLCQNIRPVYNTKVRDGWGAIPPMLAFWSNALRCMWKHTLLSPFLLFLPEQLFNSREDTIHLAHGTPLAFSDVSSIKCESRATICKCFSDITQLSS